MDWQTLPGVTRSEGDVKEYKRTVGKIDWCNTECKRCNTEIGKGVTQSERGVTQRRCQRVRAYGRSPPSSTQGQGVLCHGVSRNDQPIGFFDEYFGTLIIGQFVTDHSLELYLTVVG